MLIVCLVLTKYLTYETGVYFSLKRSCQTIFQSDSINMTANKEKPQIRSGSNPENVSFKFSLAQSQDMNKIETNDLRNRH